MSRSRTLVVERFDTKSNYIKADIQLGSSGCIASRIIADFGRAFVNPCFVA
tara:strand:- start:222 stop:374 length:153 start_codon:yes stop_codon:yes gene_type:complete